MHHFFDWTSQFERFPLKNSSLYSCAAPCWLMAGISYILLTVDGKPVEQVRVEFFPKTVERSALGYTDTKGYYHLRFTQDKNGCIPGENLVRLTAYRTTDEDFQYLPEKYNVEASENPEMNVTVKNGRQTFNFDLRTKE